MEDEKKFQSKIDENNLYLVLRLDENATSEKIHQMYRELAKIHHPDIFPHLKGKPEFKEKEIYFQKITMAFNVLKDPVERKNHDLRLNYLREQEAEMLNKENKKSPSAIDLTVSLPIGLTYAELMKSHVSEKESDKIKKARADSSFNNAKVLINQKNYNGAINILKELIEEFHNEAEYHSYLGLAMQKIGWTGYAQAEFKVALHYDPQNRIALENYKPSTPRPKDQKDENNRGFFSKLFGKK